MALPIVNASDVEKAYDTSVPYANLFAHQTAELKDTLEKQEAKKEKAERGMYDFMQNLDKTYNVSTGTPFDAITSEAISEAQKRMMDFAKTNKRPPTLTESFALTGELMNNLQRNQEAAKQISKDATKYAQLLNKEHSYVDEGTLASIFLKNAMYDENGKVKKLLNVDAPSQTYEAIRSNPKILSGVVNKDAYNKWMKDYIRQGFNRVKVKDVPVPNDYSQSRDIEHAPWEVYDAKNNSFSPVAESVAIDKNKRLDILPKETYDNVFSSQGSLIAVDKKLDYYKQNPPVANWDKLDDDIKERFAARNVLQDMSTGTADQHISPAFTAQMQRQNLNIKMMSQEDKKQPTFGDVLQSALEGNLDIVKNLPSQSYTFPSPNSPSGMEQRTLHNITAIHPAGKIPNPNDPSNTNKKALVLQDDFGNHYLQPIEIVSVKGGKQKEVKGNIEPFPQDRLNEIFFVSGKDLDATYRKVKPLKQSTLSGLEFQQPTNTPAKTTTGKPATKSSSNGLTEEQKQEIIMGGSSVYNLK